MAFIVFLIVFALFFAAMYVLTTFVGLGLMTLLGFEYQSISAVFLFFFIFVCLTLPVDFIITPVLDYLKFKKKLPYIIYKGVEFFLSFILVFIALVILDHYMRVISIPIRTKVLFSILLYLFDISSDTILRKSSDK